MRLYNSLMAAILTIALAVTSCTERVDRERNVLSSMLGREIIIPDSLEYQIQGVWIDYDMSDADFKIICYIDSAGCTPCRMKLQQWAGFISSLKIPDDVKVDFLMILNSEINREIETNIKSSLFQHPISFDYEGRFKSENSLPEGDAYHTFLLDGESRIVCVGNPVVNPKIREIYRNQVWGSKHSDPEGLCSSPHHALGIVVPDDTVNCQFPLINNSTDTITIQELVESCYCITTTINTDTIAPGEEVILTATFVADTVPGHFVRYVDVFYNEKDNPERLTLRGFIITNHNQ